MERNLFILTLICSFLFGEEFFSYAAKIITNNNVVTYQEFSISPVMDTTSFKNSHKKYLCTIDSGKSNTESTYEYLQNNDSKLLDCFMSQNVKVYTDDYFKQKLTNTNTHFFTYPAQFTVEFKENFATIYLLIPRIR